MKNKILESDHEAEQQRIIIQNWEEKTSILEKYKRGIETDKATLTDELNQSKEAH